MNPFRRMKRDPAADTQFVWLLSLFVGHVIAGVVLLWPFHLADHDPTLLSVFGMSGLILGLIVMRRAWLMASGANTLVFEVSGEAVSWGFRGRERSIPTAKIKEIHWDDSFGLRLDFLTEDGGRIRLPNLGFVIPINDRSALRSFLRRHHSAIPIGGEIDAQLESQAEDRQATDSGPGPS